MRFIFFAILSLLCVHCSTVDCAGKKWEDIGANEALYGGQSPEYVKHHEYWCKPGTFDREAYLNGNTRGTQQYCTPRHFYDVAYRGGMVALNHCPKEQRDDLWRYFSLGFDKKPFPETREERHDRERAEYEEFCKDEQDQKAAVKKVIPEVVLDFAALSQGKNFDHCSRKKPK